MPQDRINFITSLKNIILELICIVEQNSKTPKSDSLKSDAQYRLKKRLYMRQKRAQSTGCLAIDTEAIRLCPGPTTQRQETRPERYKNKRKIVLPSYFDCHIVVVSVRLTQ